MQSTQKNFLILYNGREGSSAIVSALSAQKGVNVPLFEELDPHNFDIAHSRKDYPQALDDVFATGAYVDAHPKSKKLRSLGPDEKALTTGFKWRANGDLRAVAKVLKRHNVNVFLLLRRDFLSLTCSSYVHSHGNKLQSEQDIPAHPQFTGGDDIAVAEEKRARMNQQEFKLIKTLFLKSAYAVASTRKRQIGKARYFARAGIPTRVVYYEDFDGNEKEFITSFLSKINVDVTDSFVPFCGFKKVHTTPIYQRIQGIERMENARLFRYFKRSYEDAVKEIDKYVVE